MYVLKIIVPKLITSCEWFLFLILHPKSKGTKLIELNITKRRMKGIIHKYNKFTISFSHADIFVECEEVLVI